MSEELKKYYETYDYTARIPTSINVADLRKDQLHRLIESKVFCMLPWLHLHGWPTGEAFPCCMSKAELPVGNLHKESLDQVWNNDKMKKIRKSMLIEKPVDECEKCYEQERNGFFSMRNSANKSFGHHIGDVDKTSADGHHPEFKIRYWDIRFSNICNFRCRYCGPNFSSNWWEDKAALYGKDSIGHAKFLYAGKDKDDIWNQMVEHIPHLEQIYFAGGEPLIMDEHYRLLNELLSKGMTNVRLIYNTNFSELTFKKTDVLELWKQFDSVSIGASLDAMGDRAEYMRKGTNWQLIEKNRRRMLEVCPEVDFYISATVNVFNVLHIPDFHKDWVSKNLIKAQDFNVNILQGPQYYRCDILPANIKEQATNKLLDTIQWLEDKDHLTRATNGYHGIINFMNALDNSRNISEFLRVTDQLDKLRGEDFTLIFPELGSLRAFTK
jgi:sulfatase maturation enzyme AslB (radical SAM superfamily)